MIYYSPRHELASLHCVADIVKPRYRCPTIQNVPWFFQLLLEMHGRQVPHSEALCTNSAQQSWISTYLAASIGR